MRSLRKHAHLAGAVSHLLRRKRQSTFMSTFHSGKYVTRPDALSGPSDFATFARRLHTFQQVAELAEAEGHHPDISFGWGYVTVVMQTKKIKGLHENDFIMAAKIDGLFERSEG